MSAADGLLHRCRDAIIPEPIIFTIDDGGGVHFATDQLPWRTVINTEALPLRPWARVDHKNGTVTLALDGRTVLYRRRGVTFYRNEWICDLEKQ